MNWRRGLLLAGIHLAVAAPLMILQETGYWAFIRTNVNALTDLEKEQTKEDGFPFNPCYGGSFVGRKIRNSGKSPRWTIFQSRCFQGGICRAILRRVSMTSLKADSAEREDRRLQPYPFSVWEQPFNGYWLEGFR